MKITMIFIISILFSSLVSAKDRLRHPAALSGISGVFNSKPDRKQAKNEIHTITDALSSFSTKGRRSGVLHGLGEIKRTDGKMVLGLGQFYPQRVADSISSGKVSATVIVSSNEYYIGTNPSMTFTLNLNVMGVSGIAHYWSSIKNNITYQANTWCIGNTAENCSFLHKEFLSTVRY